MYVYGFMMAGVSRSNHYGNCNFSTHTKDLCFHRNWNMEMGWIYRNTNKLKHKTRSIEGCQIECVPFTNQMINRQLCVLLFIIEIYLSHIQQLIHIESFNDNDLRFEKKRPERNVFSFFVASVLNCMHFAHQLVWHLARLSISAASTHTFAIISIPTHKNKY